MSGAPLPKIQDRSENPFLPKPAVEEPLDLGAVGIWDPNDDPDYTGTLDINKLFGDKIGTPAVSLHAEAIHFLYTSAPFHFNNASTLHAFTGSLTAANRNTIRSLTLRLEWLRLIADSDDVWGPPGRAELHDLLRRTIPALPSLQNLTIVVGTTNLPPPHSEPLEWPGDPWGLIDELKNRFLGYAGNTSNVPIPEQLLLPHPRGSQRKLRPSAELCQL
ncbi:hypothetical protein B0H63DRAFT_510387 [Podospora didyma]|uniref:Uncharacterized protein n=1 Tax=Podospora didyma TaxID=330526 RepID=A0AAE0NQ73_9PEZI|nr:hypothetical protein B0H63DRAFT_510387 [Podospora didyma]